jgi:hypothetical protein
MWEAEKRKQILAVPASTGGGIDLPPIGYDNVRSTSSLILGLLTSVAEAIVKWR